jgi:CheY-like chemotaxis protein
METAVYEVNGLLHLDRKADITPTLGPNLFGDAVRNRRERPLRLLLVEDEPFIALDLEMLVEAEGHQVVGVADTFDTAMDLAASSEPEAAFVDLNLRDGMTGLQVARALARDQGLAVAFITGNAEQLPADFAGALAVVEKPFTHHGVAELLAMLQDAREGRPSIVPRYARTPAGM